MISESVRERVQGVRTIRSRMASAAFWMSSNLTAMGKEDIKD